MLISDTYRELNAKLHFDVPDYGAGGARWKWRVMELIEKFDCLSLLDYGCGKGRLCKELVNLTAIGLREFDPAIVGLDETPKSADIVVCTDVLEHVEEVDDTLKHLLTLTNKVLFFSISTRPAQKLLPDGRNAHISLHDAEWWRTELEKYFHIDSWQKSATTFDGYARPKLRKIDVFNTFSVLDDEKRNVNVRANCLSVVNRLKRAPAHDTKAVLVCFGPSLKDSWPAVRGGTVFTVSGAHQFLLERGVMPFAHIDCDPRAYKTEQMGAPNPYVKYWMASCVDPTFIDRLKGYDVSLWHLWNSDESATILDEIEPDWWAVQGGACVGLRALALLYALGYRDFEIHGMDCSQAPDETHAGPHFGKFQANIDVKCGDRWFKTTGALASYATQFIEFRELLPDVKLVLHGDGLLQHMCRLRGKHE